MSNEQKDPFEPDWSKSPQDWPECWHAVDADGYGNFFLEEPEIQTTFWDTNSEYLSTDECFPRKFWETSLRKRPDNARP